MMAVEFKKPVFLICNNTWGEKQNQSENMFADKQFITTTS